MNKVPTSFSHALQPGETFASWSQRMSDIEKHSRNVLNPTTEMTGHDAMNRPIMKKFAGATAEHILPGPTPGTIRVRGEVTTPENLRNSRETYYVNLADAKRADEGTLLQAQENYRRLFNPNGTVKANPEPFRHPQNIKTTGGDSAKRQEQENTNPSKGNQGPTANNQNTTPSGAYAVQDLKGDWHYVSYDEPNAESKIEQKAAEIARGSGRADWSPQKYSWNSDYIKQRASDGDAGAQQFITSTTSRGQTAATNPQIKSTSPPKIGTPISSQGKTYKVQKTNNNAPEPTIIQKTAQPSVKSQGVFRKDETGKVRYYGQANAGQETAPKRGDTYTGMDGRTYKRPNTGMR